MIRSTAAQTTFQNTAETDEMETVFHTVRYHDSNTEEDGIVYVRAKDPRHALKIVNGMTQAEIPAFLTKPLKN